MKILTHILNVLYSIVFRLISIKELPSYSSPIPIHRQYAGFTQESYMHNRKSLASAIMSDKNQSFMRKLWAKHVLST